MIRKLTALATGALLLTISGIAGAQGNPQTNVVSVTIPQILRLSIDATTSFGTLDATAFDGGAASATATPAAAPAITVLANRNWTLNVKAQTANFNTTGTGVKSAGDLAVGLTMAGVTASAVGGLTTADQQLATGASGSHSGSIDYTLTYTLNDADGDYDLTVVYTLVGS